MLDLKASMPSERLFLGICHHDSFAVRYRHATSDTDWISRFVMATRNVQKLSPLLLGRWGLRSNGSSYFLEPLSGVDVVAPKGSLNGVFLRLRRVSPRPLHEAHKPKEQEQKHSDAYCQCK